MSGLDGESLVRGYTGRMLLVISVGTTVSMSGRLLLSPLLPRIIDELAITPGQAGVALSVMWGLFAIVQYPSGRLSDRLSHKTVLVAGLCLLLLGSGLLATTESYARFLAAAAIFGVGAGFFPVAALSQLSDLFEERRGQVFGIIEASINLGGVAAAGIATLVVAYVTWRVAFAPIVVGLTGVLAAMHWWNREPYAIRRIDLELRETARRLITMSQLRLIVPALSLSAFMWQGAANFLPTYLQLD